MYAEKLSYNFTVLQVRKKLYDTNLCYYGGIDWMSQSFLQGEQWSEKKRNYWNWALNLKWVAHKSSNNDARISSITRCTVLQSTQVYGPNFKAKLVQIFIHRAPLKHTRTTSTSLLHQLHCARSFWQNVFILFRKTDFNTILACIGGKMYPWWGCHKIFVAEKGGVAIILTPTFCKFGTPFWRKC